MEDILETVFFSSIVFILIYPLILAVIPDNIEDKLFSFFANEIKEDNLIEQIRILGKINGEDYEEQVKQFRLFFADNVISEREYNEIDRFITKAYFNNFESRWIPFKKADIILLLVCVYVILASYFTLNSIIISSNEYKAISFVSFKNNFMNSSSSLIEIIVIGFILLYIFSLLILGSYSMIFTASSAIFPRKGNIVRRSYILDEMIKTLKPGGRLTTFMVGPNDRKLTTNEMMYAKMMRSNRKNKKK